MFAKKKNSLECFLNIVFRFCVYGGLLIAGEVSFYSITKIGKKIPIIKNIFFSYNWCVDERLNLGQIWNAPIISFYGQASLYMFFVYGIICILGLEPAYKFMKKRNFPVVIRVLFYTIIILGIECFLGWIIFFITGYKVWFYDDWGSFPVFTSFAIAPIWFVCGFIFERIMRICNSYKIIRIECPEKSLIKNNENRISVKRIFENTNRQLRFIKIQFFRKIKRINRNISRMILI